MKLKNKCGWAVVVLMFLTLIVAGAVLIQKASDLAMWTFVGIVVTISLAITRRGMERTRYFTRRAAKENNDLQIVREAEFAERWALYLSIVFATATFIVILLKWNILFHAARAVLVHGN